MRREASLLAVEGFGVGENGSDLDPLATLTTFLGLAVVAGLVAGVAGGTDRLGEDEKRVVLTVDTHGADLQKHPTGLALEPELLAGAAPETDFALAYSAQERVAVHKAQHQHGLVVHVLDNRRDQPVFVELEGVYRKAHAFFLRSGRLRGWRRATSQSASS